MCMHGCVCPPVLLHRIHGGLLGLSDMRSKKIVTWDMAIS